MDRWRLTMCLCRFLQAAGRRTELMLPQDRLILSALPSVKPLMFLTHLRLSCSSRPSRLRSITNTQLLHKNRMGFWKFFKVTARSSSEHELQPTSNQANDRVVQHHRNPRTRWTSSRLIHSFQRHQLASRFPTPTISPLSHSQLRL